MILRLKERYSEDNIGIEGGRGFGEFEAWGKEALDWLDENDCWPSVPINQTVDEYR